MGCLGRHLLFVGSKVTWAQEDTDQLKRGSSPLVQMIKVSVCAYSLESFRATSYPRHAVSHPQPSMWWLFEHRDWATSSRASNPVAHSGAWWGHGGPLLFLAGRVVSGCRAVPFLVGVRSRIPTGLSHWSWGKIHIAIMRFPGNHWYKKPQQVICMQSMCAGDTVPSSQPPSPAPGTQRTHDHVQLIWQPICALLRPYMPGSGCSSNNQIDIIYWLYWFGLEQESLFKINPERQKRRMLWGCAFNTVPENLFLSLSIWLHPAVGG